MATEQDYVKLGDRYQRLLQVHAVKTSQEAAKATRRDELREILKKAGVDPDKPEQELIRLEKETEIHYTTAKEAIDAFEASLNQAPAPVSKIEVIDEPEQPPARVMAVADADADIDI